MKARSTLNSFCDAPRHHRIYFDRRTSLMTSRSRKRYVVTYIIRMHSVIFNPLPEEFMQNLCFIMLKINVINRNFLLASLSPTKLSP